MLYVLLHLLLLPVGPLLQGLLERNVDKRLGCGKSSMFEVRGVAALKAHPFFKGIDWAKLEAKQVRVFVLVCM